MRKTKIVCTIGPACSDEATLTEMCRESGGDIAHARPLRAESR